MLDEYAAILLLTVREDPREARADIQAKRDSLARQDVLWQRGYAKIVRNLAGTERGGKTSAAETLKLTKTQVGRIIREDDERRKKLTNKLRESRA